MYGIVVCLPVVVVQDTRGYTPLPFTYVVSSCEHLQGGFDVMHCDAAPPASSALAYYHSGDCIRILTYGGVLMYGGSMYGPPDSLY